MWKMAGWFDRLLGRGKSDLQETQSSESSSEVLAKTQLPTREVTLNDISIHTLGFNWAALRTLGFEINALQEVPLNAFNIQQQLTAVLRPELYNTIPLVSSAIAHHYNPKIPVLTPNEEEIKALKPVLELLAKLLGGVSSKWSAKFDRFIEKKAADVIQETAERVCKVMDGLGKVQKPKAQFTPEIQRLYVAAAKPEQREVENDLSDEIEGVFDLFTGGFFEDEQPRRRTEAVPIEDKIKRLIQDMRAARYSGRARTITPQAFPLLTWLLQNSGFPPDTLDEDHAAIAGSEMMQGIEIFLKAKGVGPIPKAPRPSKGLDPFDPFTWIDGDLMRGMAETFAPERLAAVRKALPGILRAAEAFLPADGPRTIKALQILAENILILSKNGKTGKEIAHALLRK
jgi:hypothetical protein